MANKDTNTYEHNFELLQNAANELSDGSISIDKAMKLGDEALKSAKKCLDILKEQKNNFTKLEDELNKLLSEVEEIDEDKEE
jgi:exonuclease VII small subunit